MSVDIEKLEDLTKAISPLPWRTNGWCIHDANHKIPVADIRFEKACDQENARYIVAACNSLPALIDELKEARAEKGELKRHSEWLERKLQLRIDNNAALIQWVQELEKALIELVKMEVSLPECAVCWDRDECTDHAHGDDCLAIRHIIDVAKEAAKEAGNDR